ncbi:MAG: transcriptional regulator [Caulobacteraceae bacterium]|nr:transcriptional regulator [Caulobacteraceae bacterium]
MPATSASKTATSTEEGFHPHPVDRHVGTAIRLRRRAMGMSQDELASKLGLTFQQVQKYERGINRVSASKLHAIAAALKTPIAYFFQGAGGEGVEDTGFSDVFTAFHNSREGEEVATLWLKATPNQRRAMLGLLRELVGSAD